MHLRCRATQTRGVDKTAGFSWEKRENSGRPEGRTATRGGDHAKWPHGHSSEKLTSVVAGSVVGGARVRIRSSSANSSYGSADSNQGTGAQASGAGSANASSSRSWCCCRSCRSSLSEGLTSGVYMSITSLLPEHTLRIHSSLARPRHARYESDPRSPSMSLQHPKVIRFVYIERQVTKSPRASTTYAPNLAHCVNKRQQVHT